jgi:hypothetical protein
MSLIIYKQTADIYKLVQDNQNGNLENYQKIFSGLKINIQPAGMEYIATTPDGAMGRLFKAFTSYSGCQNGMLIVSSGTLTISGMKYTVLGKEEFIGPMGRTVELLLRLNIR